MSGQAAVQSGVTPFAVETVVAAVVVAGVAALLVVAGYAVVVAGVAWLLLLVVGALRLAWASVVLAGMRARRRLHRPPRIPPVGLTPGPPGAAFRS